MNNVKTYIKVFLLVLLFIIPMGANAQIPSGYYDSVEGLEGEELRAGLQKIIRGHNTRTYNQLWNDFYSTDRKPNGKVWCMYTDIPYPGEPIFEFTFFDDQQGTGGASAEGQVYNREHSFPKSWWGGGTSSTDTMYTDLFHLIPADAWINSNRSNLPYGEVCVPTLTTSNGSKKGPNCYDFEGSYTGTAFEPIDAYKGDLARHYFYMLTRYMNRVESWNVYANTDMLEGSGFAPWALDMLLKWHILDPVSPKEINRNNAIYSLQGNRNPFIDFPEFACEIWGGDCIFAPVIVYTRTIPQFPEAYDDIHIEAYLHDDGEITLATAHWGVNPDELVNIIILEYIGNNIFKTTTSIPPQQNLSKVYYKIFATDNDNNTSESSLYNFTIGNPIGGGLETFDKSNAGGIEYTNGSFEGNNDITWSYTHARSEISYPINGKGMMFRDPLQSKIVSQQIVFGIQDFSVKMRKAFSNNQPRQLELYINGEKKGTSIAFGAFDGDCDSIHVFEVKNINITGNIIIEIRLANPLTNDYNQMVIDDISWTEYAPRIIIQSDKMGCFPNTPLNEYSEVDSYGIISRFLDEYIIVESHPPFEISSDGENFSYFVFFNPQEEFELYNIYTRFKPTENIFYEGQIEHYSNDISEILNVCGYGGTVSVENPETENNAPIVYYNNKKLFIQWHNTPEVSFTVEVFNSSGQRILSRNLPPENRTEIHLNEKLGLIIVRISIGMNQFVHKLLTI
jgi:endonuclease I